MKLIHNIKYFGVAAIALTGLLASCSDDVLTSPDDSNKTSDSTEKFYITLGISPKINTRALTRDDAEEGGADEGETGGGTSTSKPGVTESDYWDKMQSMDGKDYENKVSKIAVILAGPDNTDDANKAYLTVELNDVTTKVKGESYYGIGEVNMTTDDFKKFQAKAVDDKLKVKLFVVCNYDDDFPFPAAGQPVQSDTKPLSISTRSDIDKYGKKNGDFLMTNADFSSTGNASDIEFVIDFKEMVKHNKKENPYNITPKTNATIKDENSVDRIEVNVQRALARVDFTPHNVVYYFGNDGEFLGVNQALNGKPAYTGPWTTSVFLSYIGIVNINKNFNPFKMTGSKNGDTWDWNYFGAEMPRSGSDARFVQDPKYSEKVTNTKNNTGSGNTPESPGFYCNYLFDPDTFNDYRFTNNATGNSETVFFPFNGIYENYYTKGSDTYYIWKYLTPNTIHDPEYQMVSISTGVIFVGQMNFSSGLGAESEGTLRNESHKYAENELENYGSYYNVHYKEFDPTPVYFWAGTPIGTNRELQRVVSDPQTSRERAIRDAYNAVMAEYGTVAQPKNYIDWTKSTWADFRSFEDWKYTRDEPIMVRPANQKESLDEKLNPNWINWLQEADAKGITNAEKKSRHFEVYNTVPNARLAGLLIKNKFAIYTPSDPQHNGFGEYMCYYYGWLRHNNNDKPDVMGPMEFGVVRNNIYQVKVNSIKHLGHPFLNPDIQVVDPDAPTIQEWDEPLYPYIEIDFKVLDWNVKVNDDIGLGH